MLPNTWKVITAGVAIAGLCVLGSGAASASPNDDMLARGATTTVLATDDSPWGMVYPG